MKQKRIGWSQRYVRALRKHLRPGHGPSLPAALRLGRQAAALGLEMLDLARVHEQELARQEAPNGRKERIRQAEIFFDDAITPIVETHRATRQSKSDLNRAHRALKRRGAELAAANRRLRRGIVRRRGAEATLKKNGEHHASLLKESLRLQECLRDLTHRSFSAQERERRTVSTHLQNEIAQTLLGINVRLLNLKTAAKGNASSLTMAINGTQRLVEESVQSIDRFARKLELHPRAAGDRRVTRPRTRRTTRSPGAGALPAGKSLPKSAKKAPITHYPEGVRSVMMHRTT